MSGRGRRRRRRIVILGLPYFGKLLARQLRSRGWDARFVAHPGRDPIGWAKVAPLVLRADIVYLISSRIDRNSPQDVLMRLRRKPVVIHWVGTDVLIAAEEHRKGNASQRIAVDAVHWCDAPWLVGELREIGVQADFVSLPVPSLANEAPPLPKRLRVLLYLPVDPFDREVFDIDTLMALPRDFPGVEFLLIPSPAETLPQPLPPNLEARTWVEDMDALYRDISVMVRLVSHDGTSFMVLETLSRGRHVIYTYPTPGAIQASGHDAVAAALGKVVERHEAGTLGLNEEGMRYARDHFAPERLTTELDQRLSALL